MTLDFVFKTATGKLPKKWAEDGQLDWFEKYANEPAEQPKGILVADWNHFPHMAANAWPVTPESKAAQAYNWGKGQRFQAILEKMGYELDWPDKGTRCGHCNGWIAQNDHYRDSAYLEGDTLCRVCIIKDFEQEYVEFAAAHSREHILLYEVNPAPYGFVKVAECWSNDDDKTRHDLIKLGYTNICFTDQPTGGNRDMDVWASGFPSMTQWQQVIECGVAL